jgi:hypothetical protein
MPLAKRHQHGQVEIITTFGAERLLVLNEKYFNSHSGRRLDIFVTMRPVQTVSIHAMWIVSQE